MEKNKDNFSPEEIQKFAQSDAAKKLLSMLDKNAAASVRQSAEAGNMEGAQNALYAFLSDPKAQELLKQLEEQRHG